ncbi:MAG: phytoene desaturase family protein, partial [Cellulosilyticaceae bacterium]
THSGGVLCSVASPSGAFRFDESASIAINPSTYFEIFNDTGRNATNYLQWHPLDTCYKVFWPGSEPLCVSASLVHTLKNLQPLFPSEQNGYTQFVTDTSSKYLYAKKHLLSHAFVNAKDYLNPHTLYHLLRISPLTTASQWIHKYIHHPRLRELLLFQTFFMGVSPYKLSNSYAAIPAMTQVEGLMHIQGGLPAYAHALTKLFEDLGGCIKYAHPVQQVVTSSKRVTGVLSKCIFYPADRVILNTDLPYARRKLLPHTTRSTFTQSCSTFVIHLGLSKHFDALSTHNLCINHHFKEEIERVFQGQLPSTPSLYLYYPSAVDNSYCTHPEHSVLNIMVRVPNLKEAPIPWTSKTCEKLYRLCMAFLCTLPGLKDLEAAILYRDFTTPYTFAHNYHYTFGSCFGIAHTYLQSLCFRPQVCDPTYPNLYYVGCSIHPGNGASIVMDGAKLLANTIIGQDEP